MLFGIFRIVFGAIVFISAIFLIKRNKSIVRKKLYMIITLILCVVFCSVLSLFPVENIFITFDSPENVFHYTCSGKIHNIVYGNNSCMVYYSTGNNSYSHSFIIKVKNGYKISNYFRSSKVAHKFDRNGSFDVYNVLGTGDYYVVGAIPFEGTEISIFNNHDEKVNSDIQKVENSDFVYFYLEDFTNGYYLLIDNQRIPISN